MIHRSIMLSCVVALLVSSQGVRAHEPQNPLRGMFRRWNPASSDTRNVVKDAFRDTAARVSRSVVQIRDGGKSVAHGTIVTPDGFILTKASELGSRRVTCQFHDGTVKVGDVMGADRATDLAMIKVDATGLVPIEFAESPEWTRGIWLFSVGTSDVALGVGVLSADLYAIPGGILGVMLGDRQVTAVVPKSAAEKAGLAIGDWITHVNGRAFDVEGELREELARYPSGYTIEISVERDGTRRDFDVTLMERNFQPRAVDQNSLGANLSQRRDAFAEVIQHDTHLEPKHCGSPLVNLDGKAVGINIARAGRVKSYAIPAAQVVAMIDDFQAGKYPNQAWRLAEIEKELKRLDQEISEQTKELKALREVVVEALALEKDALARVEANSLDEQANQVLADLKARRITAQKKAELSQASLESNRARLGQLKVTRTELRRID